MAFSIEKVVETVIPAIITGGGTAISTILAFFKNLQKRLGDLESKVGSLDEKKGLIYTLHVLEETVEELKEALNARQEKRWRLPSFSNEGTLEEIEGRLRQFSNRLTDLETNLDRLTRTKFVTEEEFEAADRERAAEIGTIRTTLSEVRGLLKGLQMALDFNNKKTSG